MFYVLRMFAGVPASLSAFAVAFAGVPQVSRHLPRRLRESRKSLGICRGVCRIRAAQGFALGGATSRKRHGKRRETCGTPANATVNAERLAGTPANATVNAERLAGLPQTPRQMPRDLRELPRTPRQTPRDLRELPQTPLVNLAGVPDAPACRMPRPLDQK